MALCELCGRDVPRTTLHHLVPRVVGRRRGERVVDLPTAQLCPPCHKMLHRLYSNHELGRDLSSLEALRQQPEVQRFVKWVRTQPGSKGVRVK
ncbi:HNH endonuclease [Deinococcus sonorensis]|uniref:HNH endonuclease n=2 Tax=Deinococcus sonorensis TaxID=309891 RepID=A0AAU7U943_9DEIO